MFSSVVSQQLVVHHELMTGRVTALSSLSESRMRRKREREIQRERERRRERLYWETVSTNIKEIMATKRAGRHSRQLETQDKRYARLE
jgi:hypothetical protein